MLVGRQRDPELNALARELRRLDVPCLRVDVDWLDDVAASFSPVGAGVLRLADTVVSPTVVWARELSPRAVPVDTSKLAGTFADETSWPVSARAVVGDAEQIEATFVCDSRAAFLEQLASVSDVVLPGREPAHLRQLTDAQELGIRVPATILATDPHQAPQSWTRVVVKALDKHYVEHPAGSLSWFWPRIWDRSHPLPWPRPGVPAMLQEYVEHTAELRVYLVGGQLVAFRIDKRAPSDPWLAGERVSVVPVDPAAAVRTSAFALAHMWGLRYGAFDFLISDGEPVLLEVNVDGGWRWFERKAGVTSVTATAARVVAELHLGVQRGQRPTITEPLSLVAALARLGDPGTVARD